MTETNPTPSMNIKQACAFVGVSRRTIYNWVNAGKLPFRRTPGGSIRIQAADLLKRGAAARKSVGL